MHDNENYDGFLLINKESGYTSFETVNRLRKTLSIKKAGHAGTLDKNASGLLVVALGKSTKLLKYIFKDDKSYIAEIFFGVSKNTDDANGEDIKHYEGDINFSVISDKIKNFTGFIEQHPPLYSAVHINGERSYKLALKNKNILPEKRKVNIKKIEILSFTSPILKLLINCSTGTYITSIARDLGEDTGYYGYLYSLQRISVGKFDLKDSYSLLDVNEKKFRILTPIEALSEIKELEIKADYVKNMKNGREISDEWFINPFSKEDGIYKVVFEDKLISIISIVSGQYSYDLVY